MPPEIKFFYENNRPETGPPTTLHPDFIVLDAMNEWGLMPDQWRRLHVQDQADMMAYVHVKRSVEGYQSDWYRAKAEANKTK